ncbi:MAG: hypothetical protein HC894_12505 [Microcoleus sp. SM1_3_4]|nr:hypothetical protein [Microcoleus sp. SM1_3_4]
MLGGRESVFNLKPQNLKPRSRRRKREGEQEKYPNQFFKPITSALSLLSLCSLSAPSASSAVKKIHPKQLPIADYRSLSKPHATPEMLYIAYRRKNIPHKNARNSID